MDILEKFKNVKRTNEALKELGRNIATEYIKVPEVSIFPGFNEEAVWIRFHLCGWDLSIAHVDRADTISGKINLTVSPDGQYKTLEIYNAALMLYPLLNEVQKVVSATATVAEADKVSIKKPLKKTSDSLKAKKSKK